MPCRLADQRGLGLISVGRDPRGVKATVGYAQEEKGRLALKALVCYSPPMLVGRLG